MSEKKSKVDNGSELNSEVDMDAAQSNEDSATKTEEREEPKKNDSENTETKPFSHFYDLLESNKNDNAEKKVDDSKNTDENKSFPHLYDLLKTNKNDKAEEKAVESENKTENKSFSHFYDLLKTNKNDNAEEKEEKSEHAKKIDSPFEMHKSVEKDKEKQNNDAQFSGAKNSEDAHSADVNGSATNKLEKTHLLSVKSLFLKLQENGKLLGLAVVLAIIVMLFACLVVFFLNVKGPEEVMVPEVRGKELAQALIEMQSKELYPKITLRYSDVPGDEGTILDQDPASGTIVKGYSRVSLVVSRGVVVDHVENYIGMNFDDLQMHLQTLFAGNARPLIVLANPVYKADVSDAGTILEQNPPAGTEISDPVTVKLVVSRGPHFDNTRVPRLVGLSLDEMVSLAARSKLIFDFTSHKAAQDEEPGTVTGQQDFEKEFLPNYSRMTVDMAMPTGKVRGKSYGIFKASLSNYPYPVPMRLEASTEDGSVVLINILHTGGSFTMPYAVESGTTLTLFVVDKAAAKMTVH